MDYIECATLLNSKFSEKLEKFLNKKLGLKTTYIATLAHQKIYPTEWIKVICPKDDMDTKMRPNKLLRLLFEEARLDITGFIYGIDGKEVSFSVGVAYKHPDGGLNGKTLFWFRMNMESGKIKIS